MAMPSAAARGSMLVEADELEEVVEFEKELKWCGEGGADEEDEARGSWRWGTGRA